MNTQANTQATTGNSSILDLMMEITKQKFGKIAGRSKSTSYITRTVRILTDDKGNPTPAITFWKLTSQMALEKFIEDIKREPDMLNPKDVDVVSTYIKKCGVGIKQAFGTSENANSLLHNPAYNCRYIGVLDKVNDTVKLELIEQTEQKK